MIKLRFPSAPTILLIIAALVATITWFVPAGEYDTLSYNSDTENFEIDDQNGSRVAEASQQTLDDLGVVIPVEKFINGDIFKPVGIPGTYRTLESRPQGLGALIKAPVRGIIEGSDIIFMVLIIGGLIGVMNRTGAFDAGIGWLSGMLKGREYLLIVLVTGLIAIGGTTYGLAEETIAFYPILIPVFIAAGYDAMVGVGCIYIGSSVGTMCSTTNPFSTIIASDAAGINWTAGLEGRIIMWVICLTLCILYIMRYARRVKADPMKSVIHDKQEQMLRMFGSSKESDVKAMNIRTWLMIAIFSLCFVVMVIGVSMFNWWFVEMTATFFVGAILVGLIGRIPEEVFVEDFLKGAGDLLGVAFIIGFARGVSVLMDDGLISDTMLYYASNLTSGMHEAVFANVMFFLYNGLSFFIPSSSGMAVLTMPIMAPLADTVSVSREVVVNAYQYGMGLFAFINPTGLILASLAVVKIGFDRWLRFALPLIGILCVVVMIFLAVLA